MHLLLYAAAHWMSACATRWRYCTHRFTSFTVRYLRMACTSRPSEHVGNQIKHSDSAGFHVGLSRQQQEVTTSSGGWALWGIWGRHWGLRSVIYILSRSNVLFAATRAGFVEKKRICPGHILHPASNNWHSLCLYVESETFIWPQSTSHIENKWILQWVNWAFFISVLLCRKQQHTGQLGNNCAGRGLRLHSITMVRIISQLWGLIRVAFFPIYVNRAPFAAQDICPATHFLSSPTAKSSIWTLPDNKT